MSTSKGKVEHQCFLLFQFIISIYISVVVQTQKPSGQGNGKLVTLFQNQDGTCLAVTLVTSKTVVHSVLGVVSFTRLSSQEINYRKSHYNQIKQDQEYTNITQDEKRVPLSSIACKVICTILWKLIHAMTVACPLAVYGGSISPCVKQLVMQTLKS